MITYATRDAAHAAARNKRLLSIAHRIERRISINATVRYLLVFTPANAAEADRVRVHKFQMEMENV